MTRAEKIEELKVRDEQQKREARCSLLPFIEYTYQGGNYSAQWFHRQLCLKIDDFVSGKITRLMVSMPPQHGKSEISTRNLAAYLLGINPDLQIGIISYNQTVASKFGKDIQRIMKSREYRKLFPHVDLRQAKGEYDQNKLEFEVPHHRGRCILVGVGGSLTGRRIDVLLIDDVYKEAQDAWSPVGRQRVQNYYETVAETRIHNNSKILIVFTRWHEDDLAGYILKHEPEEWDKISYEAIRTDKPNPTDPRKVGEALWESRHSKERLLRIKKKNVTVFESLYQQDPKPKTGRLYTRLMEYSELPDDPKAEMKSYTDTADTGEDYLCHIEYLESKGRAFITNVIYTQQPVEVTEPLVAQSLTENKVTYTVIESNNGGRQFARNVERIATDELGYRGLYIYDFHQSKNKIARIHSMASNVQNNIYFPEYWQTKFPEFYDALTKYMRQNANEHDDAADAITGVAEELELNT